MAQRAIRACALLAFAAGTLLLSPAEAQQSRRTLTQVERDRNAATERAAQLRRDADAAREDVRELDSRLEGANARRTEAETAAAAAEERLAGLRLQLGADSISYQRDRAALESTLIAAAFAQRRVEPRAARVAVFARAAAPVIRRRLKDTAAALDQGRALDVQIVEEQRLLAEAQTAIDAERTEIESLLTRRRAAERTLVANAAVADRRARQLAAEARSLRELAQNVARRPANRGAGGAGVVPASWLAPAEGRIVRNFGASVAGGPPSQGAAVRTRAGAQVVAPATGEVAYAGLFRSYGQVLILNLDGGYALVFTGLETIRARIGETVQAGQPIGQMSASDTPVPELYVEVRRDGRPIDPARWLSSRGLVAAEQSGERAG